MDAQVLADARAVRAALLQGRVPRRPRRAVRRSFPHLYRGYIARRPRVVFPTVNKYARGWKTIAIAVALPVVFGLGLAMSYVSLPEPALCEVKPVVRETVKYIDRPIIHKGYVPVERRVEDVVIAERPVVRKPSLDDLVKKYNTMAEL